MTLHLYFARRFLMIFMGLAAVLLILLLLFDLVDQLRRFDGRDVGFGAILQLLILNTPRQIYQIFPLIMILSSLTLFLSLARSSELVVSRASGRSALVSLLSPLCVALLIGVVGVTMINPIVAATSKQFEALSKFYKTGTVNVLSIGSSGLWLRQGDANGQTVIFARAANSNATELYDVDFVSYAPGGGPVERIRTDIATLEDGAWRLGPSKVWPLAQGQNAEQNAKLFDGLLLDTSLTIEQIQDSFGRPNAVSVWELPTLISQLEEAGFSARRHKMWLHSEMALPIFLVAMVLVAAAFTMRHTRFGRTGVAALGATLSGFALYYVRNFAIILGENGQIPIELAAWAPPVASVFLALGLLLHMEDG